ncbi:phage envelope protein [Chitinophaga parva]|uniref:Phage envelope protein n=1 Tax=Chitinophaga parva TaxID=2169414 RepID=A0A2T7BP42_9BACT|nr:DUF1398 family protein [Chitinophaga parva]PUZ29410.1 phage envelope protein [Chitinophaga parva]
MFTLLQMKAAHAKVKSGADFPAYVHEIKQLGLLHYDFVVKNGQTEYHGANGFQLNGDPIYAEKDIFAQASPAAVRQIIAEHQQGKTDFLTFCQQVADAGIEKWIVDTQAMLCIYYDLKGNSVVVEPIPVC